MRSPHTVELYDLGVAEDGTLYFVMELLDGMTLENWYAGGRSRARVITLAAGANPSKNTRARVGAPRHQAGEHPVGRLGLQHDFVKVLDFRLVKSLGGRRAELARDRGRLTRNACLYGAGDGARGHGG